jgi:hypothetical protein
MDLSKHIKRRDYFLDHRKLKKYLIYYKDKLFEGSFLFLHFRKKNDICTLN